MSAKILTSATTALCGVTVVGLLLSLGLILQDINNFYDETVRDMQEFKVWLGY